MHHLNNAEKFIGGNIRAQAAISKNVSAAPTFSGAIPESIMRLHREADALRDSLAALKARLSPLLGDSPLTDSLPESGNFGSSSFANAMMEITYIVRAGQSIVNEINAQLELPE